MTCADAGDADLGATISAQQLPRALMVAIMGDSCISVVNVECIIGQTNIACSRVMINAVIRLTPVVLRVHWVFLSPNWVDGMLMRNP